MSILYDNQNGGKKAKKYIFSSPKHLFTVLKQNLPLERGFEQCLMCLEKVFRSQSLSMEQKRQIDASYLK